ncbi:DNA alkylation repair protein [Halobacillus massiliensis]|uniref:DNA alkylation repair protein n=1 Tax=Halobacillus massiliensis TaxID=1926286 RepID=UPI002481A300|nr:DNA alkylation repair protein [Halobacillus massiliensis]
MESSLQLRNAVVQAFDKHRQEDNREPMEKYLKNHFPFYGIKTPQRTKLLKEIFSDFINLSYTEKVEAAYLLYIRYCSL